MLVTSTGVQLYVYSRVPAALVPKMPGMGNLKAEMCSYLCWITFYLPLLSAVINNNALKFVFGLQVTVGSKVSPHFAFKGNEAKRSKTKAKMSKAK